MAVDTRELLFLLADCFAALREGTREIGGSILFRVEGCEDLRVNLEVPGGACSAIGIAAFFNMSTISTTTVTITSAATLSHVPVLFIIDVTAAA